MDVAAKNKEKRFGQKIQKIVKITTVTVYQAVCDRNLLESSDPDRVHLQLYLLHLREMGRPVRGWVPLGRPV